MDVRWITAFLDLPVDQAPAATDFWARISDAKVSLPTGPQNEFTTLQPCDGTDPHLRIQRTGVGEPGSHLDLYVDDVPQAVERCVAAGAELVDRQGPYATLTSPGGLPFCLAPHKGQAIRQRPTRTGASGTATLVDQVSIDTDPDDFDIETRFWTDLTRWPAQPGRAPEFTPLDRPAAMPLRILLQRRQRSSGPVTCHLDLACEDVDAATADHEAAGAKVRVANRYWTVMTDPSGTEYCLTSRLPETGQLPPRR